MALPASIAVPLLVNGSLVGATTLAAGDVRVRIDGGSWAARATVPTVTEGSAFIELTNDELAADSVVEFRFQDQDGVEFDDTVAVLLNTIATGASTTIYVPLTAQVMQRVIGTTIRLAKDEYGFTLALPIYDADGDGVSLSGKTLEFTVRLDDPHTGALVCTISNASITVGGGDNHIASFTVPDEMTADAGDYQWALWQVLGSGQTVIAVGRLEVFRGASRG